MPAEQPPRTDLRAAAAAARLVHERHAARVEELRGDRTALLGTRASDRDPKGPGPRRNRYCSSAQAL